MVEPGAVEFTATYCSATEFKLWPPSPPTCLAVAKVNIQEELDAQFTFLERVLAMLWRCLEAKRVYLESPGWLLEMDYGVTLDRKQALKLSKPRFYLLRLQFEAALERQHDFPPIRPSIVRRH